MSADFIFYGYCFFFFFIFSPSISELAERNSTISGHTVRSKCNLKMRVRNLEYPFQLPTGSPKQNPFWRFRSLRATLTAYIFGTQHDIHQRTSALQTASGLLHHLETTWTLVYRWLQIGGEFSPTLREFCIPLHCHASQTEISKRNSTELSQTVNRKSR